MTLGMFLLDKLDVILLFVVIIWIYTKFSDYNVRFKKELELILLDNKESVELLAREIAGYQNRRDEFKRKTEQDLDTINHQYSELVDRYSELSTAYSQLSKLYDDLKAYISKLPMPTLECTKKITSKEAND